MALVNLEKKDLIRTVLSLKLDIFLLYGLIADCFPELRENVVIYGAGILGKQLYRAFEKKPCAFIDGKVVGEIGETAVYKFEDLPDEIMTSNTTVIVTPIWDYEDIFIRIKEKYGDVNVISLEEIIDKL